MIFMRGLMANEDRLLDGSWYLRESNPERHAASKLDLKTPVESSPYGSPSRSFTLARQLRNGRRSKLKLLLIAFACFAIVLLLFRKVSHSLAPNHDLTHESLASASTASNSSAIVVALRHLCRQHSNGLIAGDLCNRLCYYSNLTITDFWHRHKAVAIISWGGQRLVLKSEQPVFNDFAKLPSFLANNSRLFQQKVLEHVNHHLALGWPLERIHFLFEMLWPSYKRSQRLSLADRRSLWLLITQNEYLTFAVLEMAHLFPKIMGTCGQFYAVEYVIPFKLNSFFYGNLRAKILMHLSGTLKLMSDFLNEPLHWCDVKFDNLGLSADYPKRFMLMDGDLVFTESRMNALTTSLRCRNDEECIFYDCHAKCEKTQQMCSLRTNDNIEVFCKKLVHELYGDYTSSNNKVLTVCHDIDQYNLTQRMIELQAFWVWNLSDL